MTFPPPVVALAELAKVLGVSRVRAMQLIKRAEFPAPIAVLSVGRIWAYDAVVDYCENTGRKVHPLSEPRRPGMLDPDALAVTVHVRRPPRVASTITSDKRTRRRECGQLGRGAAPRATATTE